MKWLFLFITSNIFHFLTITQMSKSNYDQKIAEIKAIPDENVKLPTLPVSEAVQEAENLVAWCQADKSILTKAGLDWALVDDLPLRAGACR
jgi:hypothetical protein